MHRIPQNLDLKDIVGHDLNLLGLGRYDVQLAFSGSGIAICVQGDISLIEHGQVIATWNEENGWSSLNFQKLLNATVVSYAVPNEKLLEIIFDKGLILQLHDSDQYEAMQIYFDNKSLPTIII